jgi:hypothetical protein
MLQDFFDVDFTTNISKESFLSLFHHFCQKKNLLFHFEAEKSEDGLAVGAALQQNRLQTNETNMKGDARNGLMLSMSYGILKGKVSLYR